MFEFNLSFMKIKILKEFGVLILKISSWQHVCILNLATLQKFEMSSWRHSFDQVVKLSQTIFQNKYNKLGKLKKIYDNNVVVCKLVDIIVISFR